MFKKKQSAVRWIVGGSSGIGLELAKRYLQAGDKVCIFAHAEVDEAVQQLKKSVKNAKQAEQNIQGYTLDVLNIPQIEQHFAQANQDMSLPMTVINCAGIVYAVPFEEQTSDQFERQININLSGSRNVASVALPYLKQARGQSKQNPKLVLVASMAGILGCYGYAGYCASKFGTIGLADVLRLELKSQNIDVAVVCPPEIETPMVFEERKIGSKITTQLKQMGGSLKVEPACKEIMAGIQSDAFFIIPGKQARVLKRLIGMFPMVARQQVDKQLAEIMAKSA
ncbi:Short-chain dehydrogenase [Acinetobacter marinus]|uniref:Short-chain dehydrogenase n=1 Tax=Acinetobacter marinus TaxID=281375 RepID=A0A1G6MZR2_9GAMM|nr:SDR family NAD(P)-dependent oxidoreductase [Acinetobacter marinus]SDC60466.1 Short-chain dehydrogenase [Acinetobacter marinus]